MISFAQKHWPQSVLTVNEENYISQLFGTATRKLDAILGTLEVIISEQFGR
jgi:hypothetical protein